MRDPRWLPVRVRRPDGQASALDRVVEWVRADGVRFTEPFFEDTARDALARPFNRLFRERTGLSGLLDVGPGLPVGGIVAHVSRCGSTLVARWLQASPTRLVLSEPAPLDSVLRLDLDGLDPDLHLSLVRGVVAAMGQPRDDREERVFLKLDAWATGYLPLLRRAFPEAPVLFLARDPVEVLVSSARHRGAHMVPGALPPRLFRVGAAELDQLPPYDYMARVVAALLQDGVRPGAADLHLDHRDLVARRAAVLALFGIEEDGLDGLEDLDAQHAKNPGVPYDDDRAGKQAAATPELRDAVARIAAGPYAAFLDLARVPA